MAWQTCVEIKSIAALIEWVDRATRNGIFGLLYRGQGKADWPLAPSLHRILSSPQKRELAEKFEQIGMLRFRKSAHLYHNQAVLPEWPGTGGEDHLNVLVLWSIMRHYGAPTRVLDWTSSPYIAAYFAVREEWDEDAAIWFYDNQILQKAWKAISLDLNDMPRLQKDFTNGGRRHDGLAIVFDYEATEQTPRMVAQQCRLSVCTAVDADQEEALEALGSAASKSNWMGKLVIPKSSKYDMFRHLFAMGINAEALFPGPDGLGKSIEEVYKLRVADLEALRTMKALGETKINA